ncbi:MAG: prophage LambdaMc01, lysozyme [Paucimonas sp.]|nr:prophage LambdaMc01, lysozyme [Paucimonas sp.]
MRTIYLPGWGRNFALMSANQERLAALIDFDFDFDFDFNLGTGRLQTAMLLKRARAGDWQAAADEVMSWIRAGWKVLRGLELRCLARRALLPLLPGSG